MRQTKRFFTVNQWGALLLAALCVGFTSCNDDDEVPVSIWSPGAQQPVAGSVTMGNGLMQTGTKVLTHDEQGRLTSTKIYNRLNLLTSSEMITYGDNTITVVETEYDGDEVSVETTVYDFAGKGWIFASTETVVESDENHKRVVSTNYSYDGDGRLVGYAKSTGESYVVNWSDGNVMSVVKSPSADVVTFTYGNLSDEKGLNGLTAYDLGDDEGALYAQGYFGVKSKSLVEAYRESDDNELTRFSYEMDGTTVKKVTKTEGIEVEWIKFN